MAGMSPTQLTLKNLRDRGYVAAVVERWNHHAGIRQDLFGFIDVIGVGRLGTIGVQCTSGGGAGESNLNARIRKIADCKNIGAVREAEWTLEVHGWKKVDRRWTVKIINVS
jgi:hypothetical protein